MLGFALELRAQGVDVRMCAPPDFAEQLARLDVPMVAAGKSVRDLVHGAKASGAKTVDAGRRAPGRGRVGGQSVRDGGPGSEGL